MTWPQFGALDFTPNEGEENRAEHTPVLLDAGWFILWSMRSTKRCQMHKGTGSILQQRMHWLINTGHSAAEPLENADKTKKKVFDGGTDPADYYINGSQDCRSSATANSYTLHKTPSVLTSLSQIKVIISVSSDLGQPEFRSMASRTFGLLLVFMFGLILLVWFWNFYVQSIDMSLNSLNYQTFFQSNKIQSNIRRCSVLFSCILTMVTAGL